MSDGQPKRRRPLLTLLVLAGLLLLAVRLLYGGRGKDFPDRSTPPKLQAGALERVAALDEPMSQLAALGSILNRPLLLLGIAVLALVAWGAVTFFAVKLAILSAARAQPRAGMALQM